MEIRKSTPEDLEQIMALFASAREFMRESGNPDQWDPSYPSREIIEADMAAGTSYVCLDEGKIVATFCFSLQREPAYEKMEEGAWQNDQPYGVVHRITADRHTRGVGSYCLQWCARQCGNIRVATHRKNLPMQRCLERNGYLRCGRMHKADGSERIAFHWVRESI